MQKVTLLNIKLGYSPRNRTRSHRAKHLIEISFKDVQDNLLEAQVGATFPFNAQAAIQLRAANAIGCCRQKQGYC